MAAMAIRDQIGSGQISRSVQNMLFYKCAKFGAFITKCTIGQLCRLTMMGLYIFINILISSLFNI